MFKCIVKGIITFGLLFVSSFQAQGSILCEQKFYALNSQWSESNVALPEFHNMQRSRSMSDYFAFFSSRVKYLINLANQRGLPFVIVDHGAGKAKALAEIIEAYPNAHGVAIDPYPVMHAWVNNTDDAVARLRMLSGTTNEVSAATGQLQSLDGEVLVALDAVGSLSYCPAEEFQMTMFNQGRPVKNEGMYSALFVGSRNKTDGAVTKFVYIEPYSVGTKTYYNQRTMGPTDFELIFNELSLTEKLGVKFFEAKQYRDSDFNELTQKIDEEILISLNFDRTSDPFKLHEYFHVLEDEAGTPRKRTICIGTRAQCFPTESK
jgi:hypothetical protein